MQRLLAALATLFALAGCADMQVPEEDPFAGTRIWLEQCQDC